MKTSIIRSCGLQKSYGKAGLCEDALIKLTGIKSEMQVAIEQAGAEKDHRLWSFLRIAKLDHAIPSIELGIYTGDFRFAVFRFTPSSTFLRSQKFLPRSTSI